MVYNYTRFLVSYLDVDGHDASSYVGLRLAIFFLVNNQFILSSRRQFTLLRGSSAEAKYHGVANVVVEISWFYNLLMKLHSPLFPATLVYGDHASLVHILSNHVQYQCTKHIKINIHYL